MQYIIGRDANTSQLNITFGQQTIKLGSPGSVPMSVSRQHCMLSVDDNGQMSIKNLKAQNVTYVNNHPIESKGIKANDVITLGADQYRLTLAEIFAAVKKNVPKVIDIRPLQKVWNEYNDAQLRMKIKQGRFVALSSGTGLITMAAVVLSFMGVGMEVRIACYIVAAILIMLTIIVRWQNATKIPLQQQELQQWLDDNYVCPNCKHSFGAGINYRKLTQYDACPYCKAKLKK